MTNAVSANVATRAPNRILFSLIGRWAGLDPFSKIALLSLGLGVLAQLGASWGPPLWFDETFTATIASQQTLAGFVGWITHEIGGPLYYTSLFLWEKIVGQSDFALRLPSQLFSMATLVAILATNSLNKHQKLAWAALLALWVDGHFDAANARPYALLILLCTGQIIAFIDLLRSADLKRALLWTGFSSAAVLTHYYSAFISLSQGIIYLIWCRKDALRTWPAVLLLAPVFAWIALVHEVLLTFATPGQNWYLVISWTELTQVIPILIPFGLLGFPVFIAIVCFAARSCHRWWLDGTLSDPAPALAALSGFLAAILIFALGTVLPSVTSRYFVLCVPATLLAVALCVERVRQYNVRYAAITLAGFLVFSATVTIGMAVRGDNLRRTLNFERASEWIMAHGDTKRLVFFWDNPTADISEPSLLGEVGGYFFRRAGHSIAVVVPRDLGDRSNAPYSKLRALARHDSNTAIIIMSDVGVPETYAARHRENFSSDPRWACDRYGDATITVLGCIPRR